ncbi:MAG: type II secretion system F family protein [archaeon]
MSDSPELFVKKTLVSASYLTIGLVLIVFLFTAKAFPPLKVLLTLLISSPIIFLVMFFYFFQIPLIRISKINREVNKEIIFASRFLIVELESGVTLYDALKNTAKSYPHTGAYFNEIIGKINIGTSMESAISEAIDICASESLIKLFWQVSNSLKTGSNVSHPLRTVTDTLIKEQQIEVNEYAKKLNPLAMFYMMIAIIMPSLGVTMFTIISIFIGLKVDLPILLSIAFINAFVQFMFVSMINSIRPPVEL